MNLLDSQLNQMGNLSTTCRDSRQAHPLKLYLLCSGKEGGGGRKQVTTLMLLLLLDSI